jgi:translation initiation factor IF-3
MTPFQAYQLAQADGLDLVEIVPTATPPVCKIIDFGKYQYDVSRREKLQKKNQQVVLVKEVRLHPQTDTHDFDFKIRHARHFIQQGHKVKVVVVFRGRQLAYKEHGHQMLKKVAEQLTDIAKIEQENKLEGYQMFAIFSADKSLKKKTEKKPAGVPPQKKIS